jgi:alkaline phosphatase
MDKNRLQLGFRQDIRVVAEVLQKVGQMLAASLGGRWSLEGCGKLRINGSRAKCVQDPPDFLPRRRQLVCRGIPTPPLIHVGIANSPGEATRSPGNRGSLAAPPTPSPHRRHTPAPLPAMILRQSLRLLLVLVASAGSTTGGSSTARGQVPAQTEASVPGPASAASPASAESPASVQSPDRIREMQVDAFARRKAAWGHWGPARDTYSSWTSHSSRLIPLYAFGIGLDSVRGAASPYRTEARIKELYGTLPQETLNPEAEYFDQTDVYRLQQRAVADGKKCVVLFVFDGMDWQTTQAAAIHRTGKLYQEGRGTGLHFQDYRGAPTDYGYFVSAPHSAGTKFSVDRQVVTELGTIPGGFSPRLGGNTPWSAPGEAEYWIGKGTIQHAYPDSSATATAMTTGVKTYNEAVNIDPLGRQLTPIARTLQEQGFAVGVVTSVPISHATPACAYANNVERDDFQDLTRDMLGLPSVAHPNEALPGVDVLLGAGYGETFEKDGNQGTNFEPGNRYLTAEDLKRCDLAGGGKYRVVQRTSGQPGKETLVEAGRKAADARERLFGFFGGPNGHLPFRTADGRFDPVPGIPGKGKPKPEIYTAADIRENPTLADMTETALDVLSKRSDRIWLMVEAGDVDWANHQNNLDASIGAVYSGDAAFRALTTWIERNVGWENAVVLLTADHGHYFMLDDPGALSAGERSTP